jgi:hypothetical protein
MQLVALKPWAASAFQRLAGVAARVKSICNRKVVVIACIWHKQRMLCAVSHRQHQHLERLVGVAARVIAVHRQAGNNVCSSALLAVAVGLHQHQHLKRLVGVAAPDKNMLALKHAVISACYSAGADVACWPCSSGQAQHLQRLPQVAAIQYNTIQYNTVQAWD